MKKFHLTSISLFLLMNVFSPNFSFAADIENGERIFNANCSACHAGGNNVIIPEKTLKKQS